MAAIKVIMLISIFLLKEIRKTAVTGLDIDVISGSFKHILVYLSVNLTY